MSQGQRDRLPPYGQALQERREQPPPGLREPLARRPWSTSYVSGNHKPRRRYCHTNQHHLPVNCSTAFTLKFRFFRLIARPSVLTSSRRLGAHLCGGSGAAARRPRPNGEPMLGQTKESQHAAPQSGLSFGLVVRVLSANTRQNPPKRYNETSLISYSFPGFSRLLWVGL